MTSGPLQQNNVPWHTEKNWVKEHNKEFKVLIWPSNYQDLNLISICEMFWKRLPIHNVCTVCINTVMHQICFAVFAVTRRNLHNIRQVV